MRQTGRFDAPLEAGLHARSWGTHWPWIPFHLGYLRRSLADGGAVLQVGTAGKVDALQAAAWVIVIVAGLGSVLTWVGFSSSAGQPALDTERASVLTSE